MSEAARFAYEAFGRGMNGKTANGKTMPDFSTLSAAVQAAWGQVAREVGDAAAEALLAVVKEEITDYDAIRRAG